MRVRFQFRLYSANLALKMSMIVIQCTSMSSDVTPDAVKGFVSQAEIINDIKKGRTNNACIQTARKLKFRQLRKIAL